MLRKYLLSTCIFFLIIAFGEGIAGNNVSSDIPFHPNAGEHYLFYQHGKLIELNGIPASHHKHGPYSFHEILNTFSGRGFQVIAEIRPSNANIHGHAFRLARKINNLIEKGIPPKNITIVGLDKGGKIALVTASYVGNSQVNYVILGGCSGKAEKNRQFIEKYELNPAGRILAIRIKGNRNTDSCSVLITNHEGVVEFRELILSANNGAGLFFMAESEWINPALAWALGQSL